MGFFSKLIPLASAAVGGFLGGVPGAFAGYAVGSSLGGGPSSVGGITGPGTGAATGVEAREYYDEAFPGTNPWERLGAGNPMGAIMSAGIQAETSRKNVKDQVRSQQTIAGIQAGAQLSASNIQAKAATDVATIHAGPAGRQATTAEGGLVVQRGKLDVERRHVTVAEDQVKINKHLQRLKSLEVDIKTGEMAKDPATAALRAEAAKMFQAGLREKEIHEKLLKEYPALLGLGTAKEVGEFISKLISGAFGSLVRGRSMPKKTSVGPKKLDIKKGAGVK